MLKTIIANEKILLFLASALLSIYIGFFAFNKESMFYMYGNLSYYILSLAIFIWLFLLYKVFPTKQVTIMFLRLHKFALILAGLIVSSYIFLCPPEFRILADEVNLLSTSKSLYEDHDAFFAYDEIHVLDHKTTIRYGLDKRFLLFPYCVHIIHCFIGYSPNNPFILNYLASFGCLFLIYYLTQLLWNKFYGYVSMLLLASFPLFAQYSMSGGYDVFSLFIGMLTFLVFIIFIKNKTNQYGDLLAYTVLLFAYTRYEATVMTVIVLLLLFTSLRKDETKKLSLAMIIHPIFYSPLAWLLFFASENKYLQIEESSVPFSLNYFPNNLMKAIYFFSGYDSEMGSNLIVFVLAILGFIIFILNFKKTHNLYINKLKKDYGYVAILLCYILSQALVKFSYKTGDLTLGIQTRMGIPFLPFIVLFSVYFFKQYVIETRKEHKTIAVLFCIFILFYNLPNASKNWSARCTYGYLSFKTTIDFLKSELPYKDDYIIVSPTANLFIPFGYNAIYPNTFVKEYKNVMRDINEKKIWQFPLIIQDVDFAGIPSEDSLVIKNKNIPTKVLYEKMIYDDWFLRFIIIKNENML